MLKFIVSVVLLVASNAYADDFVMANIASHHYDDEANYNQQNHGLGIERTWKDRDVSYQAGFYKNSISRESVYLLAGYSPVHIENFSMGIIGGAVSGYNYAPVVPAAGLLASLHVGKVLINVIATPNVKRYGVSGFTSLQLGYQFK